MSREMIAKFCAFVDMHSGRATCVLGVLRDPITDAEFDLAEMADALREDNEHEGS